MDSASFPALHHYFLCFLHFLLSLRTPGPEGETSLPVPTAWYPSPILPGRCHSPASSVSLLLFCQELITVYLKGLTQSDAGKAQ